MKMMSLMAYFIPNDVQSRSVNEYFRARILVVSSLMAFLFCSGFTVSRGVLEGSVTVATLTLAASALLTLTTPFLYRFSKSVVFSGLYLVLGCTLVLAFFSFIDGGFHSTSLLWFPVLPLFGIFFSGLRYGIAIGAMLFCHLLFLSYAHANGIVPANMFSGAELYALYMTSTASVIVILMVLAAMYLTWQRTVQESLMAVNEAKNDFLSGMSHELRTPLNSIMGFSDVLAREYVGSLSEKQREYVQHISSSSDHMLALVNDLLDIAQIESGQTRYAPAAVNVEELMSSSGTLRYLSAP